MKELKLTLDLPQSVNHIYARNKFGSTYLKKEGRDYKKINANYIKEQVKKQGWEKLLENEYCYLDEIVYMNKKGRDSDNLKKLTQDTITESDVVWFDDTYCLPRTNRIYIDSEYPRIEIIITSTETKGIFDDEEQYLNFESNCKCCSNYRNGSCSKLKKALENRIQKEIIINNDNNKWVCTSYKLKNK